MPKDDKKNELPKKWEDWKAPWEVNAEGEDIPEDDQQLDAPRLKKYLHGLLSDKVRLQGSLAETTTRAEELEGKIAEATDPKQLETLQAELTKARQERDEAKTGSGLETLKLRIALRKGLSEKQMKRLVGDTEEELEADADELLAEFGHQGEGDESSPNPRTAPQRRYSNGGDPDPDAPPAKKEKTPEEVAADYFASR